MQDVEGLRRHLEVAHKTATLAGIASALAPAAVVIAQKLELTRVQSIVVSRVTIDEQQTSPAGFTAPKLADSRREVRPLLLCVWPVPRGLGAPDYSVGD